VLSFTSAAPVTYDDVVVGAVVALVALILLAAPWPLPAASWTTFGLGGWTIIAPFALGYPAGFDRSPALWDGIITGAALLAVSAWAIAATDDQSARSH
jgi:hypothetical protein